MKSRTRARLVNPDEPLLLQYPLAVDKGGRLQRDFSNTEDSARVEIMDALEQVMQDLTEKCGLQTYLMYGCLLGAVRNGHMIGHDSDADVAYLSAYTHPFDIIRECTTAIRTMKKRYWNLTREWPRVENAPETEDALKTLKPS